MCARVGQVHSSPRRDPICYPAAFWIIYGVPRCRRDASQALNQILTVSQAEREDKEEERDRLTGGDGGLTAALRGCSQVSFGLRLAPANSKINQPFGQKQAANVCDGNT